MLKSSLSPASRFILSIPVFLLPLLLLFTLLSGCSATHSIFTVYDLGQTPLRSLRHDISLCRAAGKQVLPDRSLYWLSVATVYDIEHSSNVAVNNCLLARGWRPKLQFAGPFAAGAGDLEIVLGRCGAQEGYAGLMAKAEFSGLVAENVISAAGNESGSQVMQCMLSQGWRIIDRPPWISPDDASSSFVVDPIAETLADKFVAEGNIVKDAVKGICWMKDSTEGAKGVDWYNARRYVIGLNDQHFSGYSDWRIPRRDEVESLIDFARWNAASNLAGLLKKLGFNGVEGAIYWTSSAIKDEAGGDGIWGVNFAANELVKLGRAEIFIANVLPVRGKGWGAKEQGLPLHEPTDKAGEGEIIAARYHRCKTGNCSPAADKAHR